MHKQDHSIAEMTQMSVRVAELYSQHFGAPRDARFALMKLSEEMGELTGAWLQLHGQSRGAANKQDLENELADVLGFLLVLAHREGIDPAQALTRKWGKYLNAGA